jgi:hypothetical protein
VTKLQDTVKRGQTRWNRALLLGLSARGVGFGLLAGGCALLIGRAFGYRLDLPVAAIGLLGGLGWAAWQYRSRKVSETQVLTLLDLRTGGSGTLLHAFETGADTAAGLEQAHTRPRPAWRRSVVPALAPGLLFFALGLLMPVRATAQGAPELFAEARLAELEELAATLEETLELEDELKEELEQNIETLRGSSEEPRPTGEAMREALDALEARLDEAAESAASDMEEVVRQSSEASQGAADPDPEVREDAMDSLGDLMEKAQEQGLMPKDQLSDELQQQLSELGLSQEAIEALAKLAEAGRMAELGKTAGELGLSPEDLAKLAEALAKGLNEAALKKLAEMAEKGLLNPSGKSAKMPSAEELAEYLKKLQEQQPGGT